MPEKPEQTGPAPGVSVHVSAAPAGALLDRWDALVARVPGTDVTQLTAWARVRRQVDFAPLYVLAQRGGEVVGGAQVLHRRVPVVGRIGYLPYGPVVDPDAAAPDAVRTALADALAQLGRGRLRMLFVQPPEGEEASSAALLARGFRPSTAGIAPAGSLRVDLGDDLAVIRSRFGRKLRSWPNRWAARGVTVAPGGVDDLPLLRHLMTFSAARQGFTPPSAEYLATFHRELAAGGNAALFVGRVDGRPVAADLVTICGGMIRGRFAGFEREGEAARLSVPAAIRWEIIRWGQERGLRWLDFGGLSAATLDALLGGGPPGDAAPSSSDQPKLTFGGTAFRYPPAVELVSPVPLRVAYDLARTSTRGRRALHRAQVVLRGQRPERGPDQPPADPATPPTPPTVEAAR